MDDHLTHDHGDGGGSRGDLSIRVNTERIDWDQATITFEQVVSIAYDGNPPTGDNWVFDVDYRKGPKSNPQGILERGQSVEVGDGMIFDVTGTDNS